MELDWETLFPWIESRAGVAYNCDNDFYDTVFMYQKNLGEHKTNRR